MLVMGDQEVAKKHEGIFEFKFDESYYKYPQLVPCPDLQLLDGFTVHGKDQTNCVVILSDRFFHTFTQTMGIIFQEFKKNPETFFYLIQGTATENLVYSHMTFLFDTLRNNGVRYSVINLGEFKALDKRFLIKDFTYYPYPSLTDTFITDLYDLSKQYQSNQEPYKKVYCSRKKVKYQKGEAIVGDKELHDLPYKDDIRIDDEKKLEDYFASKGFEIVYPEDFTNFYEQINFFSSVKTLISLTSAGLINMAFMKPKTTVVELTIPMIVVGTVSIHNHYQPISWAKDLVYISIPSKRSAKGIIEHIEENNFLSEGLMKIINE